MKATPLIAAVFAVALHGQAVAEDKLEAWEIANNNLSHEMTNCAVFYSVMAKCILTSDQETSDKFLKAADTALAYAKANGEQAGISKLEEVIKARANMARKGLLKLIDSDCSNISIAMDKYLDRCVVLAKDPTAALAEYIDQAQQRMAK